MKTTSNLILGRLRSAGHRLTPARTELVGLVLKSKTPLAVDEIMAGLSARKLSVNKTTVYREIEFLRDQGVLSEIHFDDRKKRYEIADREHHHHLICYGCKSVEDVTLSPETLRAEKAQEALIASQNSFSVMSHCMEFFGMCKKCS